MNIIYAFYLFGSATILLLLAAIAWGRRPLPAGREFAWFAASTALLVASYGLELTQDDLAVLKLNLYLEWLPSAYLPAFWLLFSLVWCGYGHLADRGLRTGLLAFSTLHFIVAETNDYHGLLYTALWVDKTGSFPMFRQSNGPWFWVDFVYMSGCVLLSNILFIRQFRHTRPLHRRQALIMMLATFIPWFCQIGFTLGIANGIYLTAFGLSISGLLFAWGIFRQHILEMVPVARFELVEMMRDPVLVFNEAGRLVDHNRAASSLLDTGKDQGDELTRADISRNAPELATALELAERGENRILQQGNRVFSLSRTDLHLGTERGITLCLLHDITEQFRAEEQLQALTITLEERIASEVAQNRAKDQALARQARVAALGEMVGAIAHQWRQPLTILAMIVQDFHANSTEGTTPTESEWAKFKVNTMTQIRHMSQTIDEFLNYQRPNQIRERFPIIRCLEESLRLFSAQFKEYRINQELRIPPGVSPCCFGTPSQLTQVLLNLLANAKDAIVDARSRNSAPEQGRVIITLDDQGERLLITVTDNGSGIPEEQRERIFDPYVTTKEKQGGSGLGLYLARMLVETGLGGSLSHADLPEGTSFFIELPVSAEEQP